MGGRGAELPLYCSLHICLLLCAGMNALDKSVWRARLGLSPLMAASASLICTYTVALRTQARKEMVQDIMTQHLVYREWKFSTDVGVLFCIH